MRARGRLDIYAKSPGSGPGLTSILRSYVV
jgi:hypothetical protein